MCECAQSHLTTGTLTTGFFSVGLGRSCQEVIVTQLTHKHTYTWRCKCRKLCNWFIVGYVFEIDIVAWFAWIGEITAMRMLFNGNNSYHHFIISKILKSFLFNFPCWSCLREPCAYPHFPMWKNHECCLPLNIFSWVFGFGPPQACIFVFENYQMPTHKPFLDPWPWLGHSDVLKVRWWLLPFVCQGWLPYP